MHYGSSSNMSKTAEDAPYLVSLAANSFILPISTTPDWIFSGILGRYPGLKVCMSESQIGWVARHSSAPSTSSRCRGTGIAGTCARAPWPTTSAATAA